MKCVYCGKLFKGEPLKKSNPNRKERMCLDCMDKRLKESECSIQIFG